jgi:tight adherence protein B
VSLLAAFVCGLGLPRFILSRVIKRRQAKFLIEFANAIDIIVRGVKSGLPLSDCLQIIAAEAPEPMRGEFVDLVDSRRSACRCRAPSSACLSACRCKR